MIVNQTSSTYHMRDFQLQGDYKQIVVSGRNYPLSCDIEEVSVESFWNKVKEVYGPEVISTLKHSFDDYDGEERTTVHTTKGRFSLWIY